MFNRVWFLCVVDSRSIPRPTPLRQLHDHGSQLWWVSANGSISDGWSNRADTQHKMAAIIFGGHTTLVNQVWLRARALTVVGQCSSNSMVLKRTCYVRKLCNCISNRIFKCQYIKKSCVPPVYMVQDLYHLSVMSFHLVPQEFFPSPLQREDHE